MKQYGDHMTNLIRNEITLKDGVIHCQECEGRLRSVLITVEGVLRVDVDRPNHKVLVHFDRDKLDLDRIGQVLEHMGFPLATASESQSGKT